MLPPRNGGKDAKASLVISSVRTCVSRHSPRFCQGATLGHQLLRLPSVRPGSEDKRFAESRYPLHEEEFQILEGEVEA